MIVFDEKRDTPLSRPLMRYFGGKWRAAQWILEHFPPHVCYVEPFLGAGSLLLQKASVYVEFANDRDEEVVNLFQQLRDRPVELIRAISLTPFSRAELRRAYEGGEANALERARRLLVLGWQARGGPRTQWSTGWVYQRTYSRGRDAIQCWNDAEFLWPIARRLKEVALECGDALDVIPRFDSPDTLFYVDPPYLGGTRNRRWADKAYRHEFNTEEEHRELAECLLDVQGMVLVSGYRSDLYSELYESQGWRLDTKKSLTASRTWGTECLWINPAARERARQRTLEAVS